ncbi:hypothetical protein BGZ46_006902 [Entomortierella lignicola]|nr:hypothetical protein BGZ46_006902 [Entomortierella lignicola]
MPTVIFFKSNSEIERVVGADVNEIQTLIKEHESSDAFSGIGQTLEGSSAPIVSPVSGIPKFIEGPGGSCQIQIRLLDGSAIRGEFEPSHTLHRVHDFVKANMDARGTNISEFSLMTNFPKVIYDGAMLDQTLQDAKLTPRAQLIVKT